MHYYTVMVLFTVFSMLMLVVMAKKNNGLPGRAKKNLISASLMILIAVICEFLGEVLNGGPSEFRGLHQIVKFLELSLGPAIPVTVANAVRPTRATPYFSVLLGVHALTQFVSIWLGITFYVNEANVYSHCALYSVYYVVYLLGLGLMVLQVAHFSLQFQCQNRYCLVMILCFTLFSVTWSIWDNGTKVAWLGVSIADIFFYIFYCDTIQQTDELTGLLNRRNYENRIKAERRPVMVLMADVDSFKQVNDSFGHQFGDLCLAQIGAALKEVYGKTGFCYRVGGDEFCVITSGSEQDMERMNAAFFHNLSRRRKKIADLPHVSVGYVRYEPERTTLSETAAKADQMMYAFKEKSKRNRRPQA